MKPLHLNFPYTTYDLTECKLAHIGGRFVMSYPTRWKDTGNFVDMPDGRRLRQYTITRWSVVEVDVKLKGAHNGRREDHQTSRPKKPTPAAPDSG